jgi:hypothetical protein
MEKTFGEYKYTYAPITFMNYNAKGDNDYADGIKPDVNFDDYWNESNLQSSHQTYSCYAFPMPMNDWGEVVFEEAETGGITISGDFALCETVLQVGGYTMLKSNTSAAIKFKPAEMVTTRATTLRTIGEVPHIPNSRAYGATLTEQERVALGEARK